MREPSRRGWVWLLVGLAAGLGAQAAALTWQGLLGILALPDALADLVLRAVPAPITARILDQLQFLAKPLLLIGLIVAQVAVAALGGIVVGRWVDRGRAGWRRRLRLGGLVAGLALLGIGGLAAAASGEAPTAESADRTIGLWGGLLVGAVAYGLGMVGYGTWLASPDAGRSGHSEPREDRARSVLARADRAGRRSVLAAGALGLSALLAGGALARIIAAMGEQASVLDRGRVEVVRTADAASPSATPDLPATPTAAGDLAVGGGLPTVAESPPSPTSAEPLSPTVVPTPVPTEAFTATATPVPSPQASASPVPTSTRLAVAVAPAPTRTPLPTPATGGDLTLPPGISPEVTPVEAFYVVSKNFVDPRVDPSSWTLEITGLVEHPLRLSYADFLALPAVSEYVTLECISNPVGGNLISNGLWTGVPVAALLTRAVVLPQATAVNFTSVDNYAESHDLGVMLGGGSLLAHSLDGAPLTPKHGAPARLITLNRYGMKNPKWIRRIEVAAAGTPGYWERRGWDALAIAKTMSRIDVPRAGTFGVGPEVRIGGIAYAGSRGIVRVEVSPDGGKSWGTAQVEPPLAPSTWVRWVFPWRPARAGPATLLVRATDGTGALQAGQPSSAPGSGAEGYDQISIQVAG